ncbi:peptidase S8/S53 domain-containing protein [Lactarius quietus]|nr:peptidase S8/S53 domain-containing protein [Lactarius quietus]
MVFMLYYWTFVLFVLAAEPLASPVKAYSPGWDNMVTKHSWDAVPADWESLGHLPANTTIDLYVALKPYSENALIDALYEVSTPGHQKYRAHLSKEQVAELVAPHPDTLDFVKTWLEHYEVPSSVSLTHGGSALTLTGVSVTKANDLLGASYQLYRHIETNETIVRTVGYALPEALHEHVLMVSPTTNFASQRMQSHTPRELANLTSAFERPSSELPSRDDSTITTPPYLRWLYRTYDYEPIAWDQNALGVAGFLFQYPSQADLTQFMRNFRSDGADATFRIVDVNKAVYGPIEIHFEANLNIQYTEALTYPTPNIFYSTSPGPKIDWFYSWLDYILELKKIPQTISISYLYRERDVSYEYAISVCRLFAQLGARGVSVLLASGDHGVGEGNCQATDGSVHFEPLFPASCPFVTSVGGTTNYMPENAANISGGGFSNYFRPDPYQEKAMTTFFRDHLGDKYQGLYNPMGRGIPDIAAQAKGFQIFLNGAQQTVQGTSGSAPVVAGIISLLNDYMLSEGMTPLGFLNPWLYGRALTGLNDITSGTNPGCNTDGFTAVVGWDPVTGLGTPDFERLFYIISH